MTNELVGVLGTHDETYAISFDGERPTLRSAGGTLRVRNDVTLSDTEYTINVHVTRTVDGETQSSRTESVGIATPGVGTTWRATTISTCCASRRTTSPRHEFALLASGADDNVMLHLPEGIAQPSFATMASATATVVRPGLQG